MELTTKVVTGEEIYEAIEADGFGVIREEYFQPDPFAPHGIAACLIGMAGLNLRLRTTEGPYSLEQQLNMFIHPLTQRGIASHIINEFDAPREPSEEEANEIETKAYKAAIESGYTEDEADVIADDARKDYYDEIELVGGYVLDSWEDALAMAKEALSHVWEQKFEVEVFDYEEKYSITLPDYEVLKELKGQPTLGL